MPLLAHGVGSRGDLPLPLWQFVWAAVFAIVISFVALGALWTTPRLAEAAKGRSLRWTRRPLRILEPLTRVVSLGLFVVVMTAGLWGSDIVAENLAPVSIYVMLWVVLQIAVPIVGNVWVVLSPFDTLAAALERFRPSKLAGEGPGWSHWLAPIAAAGFLFLELIHPQGDAPRTLGWAMLIYTAVVMAGVWRWGRAWLAHGELFAVHLGLLGAMAPIVRDDRGWLRVRAPLSGLAAMRITPAATATLLVVLGGVSFDGLGESELWRDIVGRHSGWDNAMWRLAGIITVTALLSALYLASIRWMASITKRDPRVLANLFAPSLVPIVFGYTVAHYLQLAIDESQTFVFRLSDPYGRGWDVLGTADGSINFDVVSTDMIAWFQALGVVVGHIAGVVVAHDRAIATFDERDALRSQYVMLCVMVIYSVVGLWLLLNA